MTFATIGTRFALSPANKDGKDPTPLQSIPWQEAFLTQHAFDAHAWPYVAPHRLAGKAAVDCSLAFLDYDEHLFSPTFDHASFLDRLQRIPPEHYLYRVAVIYPTKGGMRLVYRFAEPVPNSEYGAVVRSMAVDLARITNIKVDPSTDQWHRCFRLPQVVRNDDKARGPTWECDYFFPPILSDEVVVSANDIGRWNEALPWDPKTRIFHEEAGETRPAAPQVSEARRKQYKKLLKLSRFKDYLFDGAEIQAGRRDQTLLCIAGELVGKAFKGLPDSTPNEIYAIICSVLAIGEGWSATDNEKIWRLVQHAWNGEVKKDNDRHQRHMVDLSQREAFFTQMEKSLPARAIPTDLGERAAFLARHYCLQTASGAFVVRADGEYSRVPLKASQIPAHFHDGLHYLSDDAFRNKSGVLLSGNEILNRHSVNLDEVHVVTGLVSRATLRLDDGKKTLEVVPFALRQDYLDAAEFDADVGGWIDSFYNSALLKRWIASALALHRGPTAALYMNGPARVGKTLLALGLAQCFHGQPIPAAQAFSEFNGALLTNPIILVDEGLPTRIQGMDTADLFRSLVTGSAVSTQKKFQDAINSEVPYRILFAANSYDMVKKLIGRRTMEEQDRDAFRERILVFETGQGPANYLDARGARAFTSDWLTSGRLARHLMKLYQTLVEEQDFQPDGRLLVEGKAHAAFTLTFDLSGAGHEVVDDLVMDLQKRRDGKTNHVDLARAIEFDGGTVWIKKRPYVKFRTNGSGRTEQYSTALDRFLTNRTRQSADMATQFALDVEKLLCCAQHEGLATGLLQELRGIA